MFSEHETMEAWRRSGDKGHGGAGMKAAMLYAVELAAARGGTMTAEDLEAWLVAIERERGSIAPIRQHISALGARNAVLEAEREDYRNKMELAQEGEAERDRAMHEAQDEVEKLRERLSAAEEGNRELVKRAQQVDKTAGHDNCPDNPCPAHFPYCEGVNKETPQRWPCSPTCTHDDAATPGHPERVAEASRRFMDGLLAGYSDAKEAERVKERSEAVNRVVADPALSVTEAAAYEQGAEAMRVACLEAVISELVKEGNDHMIPRYKSAIQGAVP